MSFTDDLKRSLGFEETENSNGKKNGGVSFSDMIRNAISPQDNPNQYQQPHQPRPNPNHQYRQAPRPTPTTAPRPMPRPTPIYDDMDDVIIPEQSFYEVILIRPKTIDDINYVVDQVIEEQNPVIVDLSFLEKESEPNYRLAGEKIKQVRAKYGAQALLLCRSEDKNLLIISPKKVKVVNKK